jgi:polysaccharide pyruvyl transferase WcaK-like protein
MLVSDRDPEQLPRKLLAHYEAVAVTERRSRRHLKRFGLTNLVLIPEPAFLVRPRPRSALSADTVALCLTYPGEAEGLLYRSYSHLMGYILEQTSLSIALIPYCVKPTQNDLVLFRALYRQYRDTGRVHFRQDGDAPGLRGDIRQCSCCVGAAGAVAAWGCGVPALCLSATCRTRGLSQALLGTWQDTVLPWQELKSEQDLTFRFKTLLRHQDRHRRLLETNLQRLR